MVMTIISYVLNWWSWVVSIPPSFLHVFPWPSFQKKGERWSWKVSKPPIDDYSWPSIQYFLEMMVTTLFFGHFWDKVLGFEASRPSRYDARIHLSHQNQGSLLKIWNGPRITLVSRSHISPFSFFLPLEDCAVVINGACMVYKIWKDVNKLTYDNILDLQENWTIKSIKI